MPGVPGAKVGFCLILGPEAYGNYPVFEHVGRGQILKTVMLSFPRKEKMKIQKENEGNKEKNGLSKHNKAIYQSHILKS